MGLQFFFVFDISRDKSENLNKKKLCVLFSKFYVVKPRRRLKIFDFNKLCAAKKHILLFKIFDLNKPLFKVFYLVAYAFSFLCAAILPCWAYCFTPLLLQGL